MTVCEQTQLSQQICIDKWDNIGDIHRIVQDQHLEPTLSVSKQHVASYSTSWSPEI